MKDPFDDGQPRVLDEEQHAYLCAWMRRAADLLGLRDWRINVSPFGARPNANASTWIADESDEAWTAVARSFVTDGDADERRSVLAHELLHPHFHRVTRMAERLFENELGRRTEAVLETAVEIVEEQTIERLAHAIAGWLPSLELPEAGA